MIVKDEEKFLPTCLESVKGYVDEIIIVDTGSTDRTIEIARRYNAKIYCHAWENSFSKARNYSLKYATGDWILILDADEEIERKDAYKLRNVIKDNSSNVILIPVISKFSNGKNLSIANSERIFKNHLDFHYESIVHNKLKYTGSTRKENIKLYHHGYNQGDEQMDKKFARTAALLKKQIKEDPENALSHHYLSLSYLDREKNDECIDEALAAIRLFERQDNDTEIRLLSYYTASVAFYRKNNLPDAEKYALKALNYYSDYIDAYCLLSSIYFLQKEYDKCIDVTGKYLNQLNTIKSDTSSVLTIPYNTLQQESLAYARLSIIYHEQGDEQKGEQALKDAVNSTDDKWEPYLIMGKHFQAQQNLKLAERFLADGLKYNPGNKDILYYIAEMHGKSGASDKALACFEEILNDYPDEIPAQYNRGLLLLKGNQFEKAIKSFKLVTDKSPSNFDALFNLAFAYEEIGKTVQAKDVYQNIMAINSENPEVLLRLGSLYLNESNYARAKDCFLNILKFNKYLVEAHLGLSKIYLSLNDPESCVRSCDELLKSLNLSRNMTINSIRDLSNLYINIGTTLSGQRNEPLARFSIEIAMLLDPDALERIQTTSTSSVTSC